METEPGTLEKPTSPPSLDGSRNGTTLAAHGSGQAQGQVQEPGDERTPFESSGIAEPAPARPRLRGRFLGARELVYDGEVVWPVPGEPEEAAMELLVFLGVQDPSGVRAEVLGDSFWEEDDDEARPDRLKKRRYR